MCVQRFDDSLNPAIHTTYRISLRSSSFEEPRDPSLRDMVNSLSKDFARIKLTSSFKKALRYEPNLLGSMVESRLNSNSIRNESNLDVICQLKNSSRHE